jgi:hypothetical protein
VKWSTLALAIEGKDVTVVDIIPVNDFAKDMVGIHLPELNSDI